MLVIGRSVGKETLIGDHSIVTVVSSSGHEVKLGFLTKDSVQRVDSPELVIEAAKIKARLMQEFAPKPDSLVKMPVYVGVRTFDNGEVDLRASLRTEMVDVVGYRVTEVGEYTALAPPNHQFIVLRCMRQEEIETVKKLINARLMNWRFYEQMQHTDGSFYALFVHATARKAGGDVIYLDLNEM
jgi:sRNA-binding carbon storage regulator CsrA